MLQLEIEFAAFGSRSAAGVGRKGSVMAKIVSALLIPWEAGVPGIAYQLQDGTEVSVDGRFA